MGNKGHESIESVWREVWEALDDDRVDAAADRIRRARASGLAGPDLDYLDGMTSLEADDVEGALALMRRASQAAPDWIDATVGLAWAAFRACQFEEAAKAADTVLAEDPGVADMHELRALLSERAGRVDDAEAAFAEARRLEPNLPDPVRLDEAAFRRVTEQALERLPEAFRNAMTNVAIMVEPVPPTAFLTESRPPLDPQSLGMFSGASRIDTPDGGELPDVIHLFQRNLERMAETPDELEEEIAITLYHEIAHYLGFDEDDMPGLGLE